MHGNAWLALVGAGVHGVVALVGVRLFGDGPLRAGVERVLARLGRGAGRFVTSGGWRFFIDRGGTFTDCLAISPSGGVHVTKVFSSDRAPLEAIESVLARADGGEASDVFSRTRGRWRSE
ncbi:MAG: hydantoinase/oxoprolinase N-terminal domain-containing protein [Myxococcota bacterium]